MARQTNIGQAFPLESLGSDIARNSFNYQSILNGLIEWNSTTEDTVNIRLSIDTDPWFHDYEIPSKRSVFSVNTNTSYQRGDVDAGNFSVTSLMNVATYGGVLGDPEEPGDILTVRMAMKDSGNSVWQAYYSPMVQPWESGIPVREGNYYSYMDEVYVAKLTVSSSLVNPSVDIATFGMYYADWVAGGIYPVGSYVNYNGSMYISLSSDISYQNPLIDTPRFSLFADSWDASVEYAVGSYVCHDYMLYLALEESMTNEPGTDDSVWKPIILFKVPVVQGISVSGYFRWYTTVDLVAIIYRNESSDGSTPNTEFYVQNSIKTVGNPSIYERSTAVFPSCNMSFYPSDQSPLWSESAPIAETDTGLGIDQRQDYSAVMVFDHANQQDCKTINFINYDGPDLDQGLCIYLPIQSELVGGEIVEPEDAFTYEFYFRIYPNVNYTVDAVTRDHIVNKSQIYVYSAPDADSIARNNCSTPIAKFSMARMTNFHIFAENVTIPDKPVVYRATFMYSKVQRTWLLYDYYQVPDHVFAGPVGFIDPQNPSNPDYNSPELSNINPDATHIGYETCAFPTYVDVFSNPDLKPYKSGDGKFFNRSI